MRTREVALIRKLCNLGLSSQILAQSLLPALRQFIPPHSGGVFWVDDNFQMTGLYGERSLSPDAMVSYESYYRREEFRTVAWLRGATRSTLSTPVELARP